MWLGCRLNGVDTKLGLAVAVVAQHVELCTTASRNLAQTNGPSRLTRPILQECLGLPVTELASLVFFIDHVETLLEVSSTERRRSVNVDLLGGTGERRSTAHHSDHFRLRVKLRRPDLDLTVGGRERPWIVHEIDCGSLKA